MEQQKRRIFSYELPGGWQVIAGASDADNDYVSLRLAAAADWWFHVAGVPGSHVILRARPDQEPSRETLRQAASVAAYHSKARNAGRVNVHCTRARNVRKPRGAKSGTVQVSEGKTLAVRPDIRFATRLRFEDGGAAKSGAGAE